MQTSKHAVSSVYMLSQSMEKGSPKTQVLQLPAELRNIVYRDILRKTYLIPCPSGWARTASDSDVPLTLWDALSSFSILYVSKQTRKEALALLYSEGTFRYWINTARRSCEDCHVLPAKEHLDLMQRIEIHVSIPNALSDAPSLMTVHRCQHIVDKLINSSGVRESLLLRFGDCDTPNLANAVFPLVQTLARLRNFRLVTVEICSARYQPYPKNDISLTQLKGKIQPAILSQINEECEETRYKIRRVLQLMVGPVVGEGEVKDARNVCYARYLKFRPRRAERTIAR